MTQTELLCALVRCKSISANVDDVNNAVTTMRTFLEARGLWCKTEDFDGRKALYCATRPGNTTPAVLFNAHLDVVPPSTPEQCEPVIDGDTITARGANDCLGNACAIAFGLAAAGADADAGAIFTTDEEIGGDTTAGMIARGYTPREMCVIMDISESAVICTAQKGILVLEMTAHGKGGHSSEPWNFDNPIFALAQALTKLQQAWRNPTSEEDTWRDTWAPCQLKGSDAENQIPDTASAILNIRYLASSAPMDIVKRVQEASGLEDVRIIRRCLPFEPDGTAPLLEKLRAAIRRHLPAGREITTRRLNGATDARHFAVCGKAIAIIGIDGDGCHSAHETASLSAIASATEIVTEFALEFH